MSNLPSIWRDPFFSESRDPMHTMARMQRQMDRLFSDFWNAGAQPLYKVADKDSHFLLSMEVPGFSKDDIKVEVLENQLHVFGEKKSEHEEKKGKRFESSYGSIEQWFTLPANTKAETIEARVENGVLHLAVPKTEASKAKEIKISEGKSGIFSKLLEKKNDKVA